MERREGPTAAGPPVGVAFLLAQLGSHATARFAERVKTLDLTPAHVGVLRTAATSAGGSQRAVAGMLQVAPSKIVGLVDDLETRGLLERRRSATDRRNQELHLTAAGTELMGSVRAVARDHEQAVTGALEPEERAQLIELLQKVAAEQGLSPGAHPGYRNRPGRRPRQS